MMHSNNNNNNTVKKKFSSFKVYNSTNQRYYMLRINKCTYVLIIYNVLYISYCS